jgi:hypothetical protein
MCCHQKKEDATLIMHALVVFASHSSPLLLLPLKPHLIGFLHTCWYPFAHEHEDDITKNRGAPSSSSILGDGDDTRTSHVHVASCHDYHDARLFLLDDYAHHPENDNHIAACKNIIHTLCISG